MMKRIFTLCLIFSLLLCPMTADAAVSWPENASIQADGGIVIEADTGTVLYGKNIHETYYPASITKILTALIVLEHCDLDEMVTFSHDAVYNVEEGSSSAGIDEGDELTVRDCLYALLLASANESANALAEHVAGSREAFADLMNEKAESLGCQDSHFANPSGLNDEDHYTSAYDMALITQAAIQNPTFVEISGSRTYRLYGLKRVSAEEFPNGYPIANHHQMCMKNTAVYYPGAFCGKTGYTSLAGNTLVTCAERNGMTLIAVVLNGHQTHYSDTKALFDFGFDNFQSLRVADYETKYTSITNDMLIGGIPSGEGISLTLSQADSITIPKAAAFSDAQASLNYNLPSSAPSGAVAQIRYSYEDRYVGCAYLCRRGAARIDSPSAALAENAILENTEAEMENPAQEPLSAEGSSPEETQLQIGEHRDSALNIRIPAGAAAIFGALVSLGIISAVVITLRRHRRQQQESDQIRRHQRHRERMDDVSYSSSEFGRIMEQYRSSTTTTYTKRPSRSRRRHFPFRRK